MPPVPGEIYRFLLRMPAELRDQLRAAAERSGRSLNAELVDRLERSVANERSVRARLGSLVGQGSPGRRGMSPQDPIRRRRLALGGVAALGVIAIALVAGALTRDSGTQATGA